MLLGAPSDPFPHRLICQRAVKPSASAPGSSIHPLSARRVLGLAHHSTQLLGGDRCLARMKTKPGDAVTPLLLGEVSTSLLLLPCRGGQAMQQLLPSVTLISYQPRKSTNNVCCGTQYRNNSGDWPAQCDGETGSICHGHDRGKQSRITQSICRLVLSHVPAT